MTFSFLFSLFSFLPSLLLGVGTLLYTGLGANVGWSE